MMKTINVIETVTMITQVEVEVGEEGITDAVEKEALAVACSDENYPQNETRTLGEWIISDCLEQRVELAE